MGNPQVSGIHFLWEGKWLMLAVEVISLLRSSSKGPGKRAGVAHHMLFNLYVPDEWDSDSPSGYIMYATGMIPPFICFKQLLVTYVSKRDSLYTILLWKFCLEHVLLVFY